MAANYSTLPSTFMTRSSNPCPTQAAFKHRREVVFEVALNAVVKRVTHFLANIDYSQFDAIFKVDSPPYRFARTFDPEQLQTLVFQAFRTPNVDASKEELQAIIDDKLALKERLAHLERIFGLIKAAGFNDRNVGSSLAWLAKTNKASYSELVARVDDDLNPRSSTATREPLQRNHSFPIPDINVIPPTPSSANVIQNKIGQPQILQNHLMNEKDLSTLISDNRSLQDLYLRPYTPRGPGPIHDTIQIPDHTMAQIKRLDHEVTNDRGSQPVNLDLLLRKPHVWAAYPPLDTSPESSSDNNENDESDEDEPNVSF